jgi:ABC-type branched-subunit amino acid transport system permease subunit
VALIAGAAAGGIEWGFVRRIADAPRVLGTVVTLGLAQFLILFGLILNEKNATASTVPGPVGFPSFTSSSATSRQPRSVAMWSSPRSCCSRSSLFLRKSRYGLAIRASADNPDAASLAGVKASRMVTLSWASRALAALLGHAVYPTLSASRRRLLGPTLLIYALVGAVFARFQSLVIAFFASVVIGLVDPYLRTNQGQPGLLGARARDRRCSPACCCSRACRRVATRTRASGASSTRRSFRPTRQVAGPVKLITPITSLIVLGIAIYVGSQRRTQFATFLSFVVGFTIVGLSVIILTGIAGQLSLGQFAFAAIAGAVSVKVTQETGQIWHRLPRRLHRGGGRLDAGRYPGAAAARARARRQHARVLVRHHRLVAAPGVPDR